MLLFDGIRMCVGVGTIDQRWVLEALGWLAWDQLTRGDDGAAESMTALLDLVVVTRDRYQRVHTQVAGLSAADDRSPAGLAAVPAGASSVPAAVASSSSSGSGHPSRPIGPAFRAPTAPAAPAAPASFRQVIPQPAPAPASAAAAAATSARAVSDRHRQRILKKWYQHQLVRLQCPTELEIEQTDIRALVLTHGGLWCVCLLLRGWLQVLLDDVLSCACRVVLRTATHARTLWGQLAASGSALPPLPSHPSPSLSGPSVAAAAVLHALHVLVDATPLWLSLLRSFPTTDNHTSRSTDRTDAASSGAPPPPPPPPAPQPSSAASAAASTVVSAGLLSATASSAVRAVVCQIVAALAPAADVLERDRTLAFPSTTATPTLPASYTSSTSALARAPGRPVPPPPSRSAAAPAMAVAAAAAANASDTVDLDDDALFALMDALEPEPRASASAYVMPAPPTHAQTQAQAQAQAHVQAQAQARWAVYQQWATRLLPLNAALQAAMVTLSFLHLFVCVFVFHVLT